MKKTAVILFNLGGPNSLEEVKPFLFNLFYDRAIINLPNPLRWVIAKIISMKRTSTAQKIYNYIGGKSPILEETKKQADALRLALKDENIEIFISMRYSLPDSTQLIKQIESYKPDNIILLPLYPQFSTTTTKSSIDDLTKKLKAINFKGKIRGICCYNTDKKFIEAHVANIKNTMKKLRNKNFRILFSAHSLPEKIIKAGDPYQWQIENTVEKIVQKLNIKNLDYKTTYQSKVTPVKWIGPCTEEEIKIAAVEKDSIIIVPVAFVSEHSETLVELDIEYAEIAKDMSVEYLRVPTLGTNKKFIQSLAEIVKTCLASEKNIVTSDKNIRICPESFSKCICGE